MCNFHKRKILITHFGWNVTHFFIFYIQQYRFRKGLVVRVLSKYTEADNFFMFQCFCFFQPDVVRCWRPNMFILFLLAANWNLDTAVPYKILYVEKKLPKSLNGSMSVQTRSSSEAASKIKAMCRKLAGTKTKKYETTSTSTNLFFIWWNTKLNNLNLKLQNDLLEWFF